MSLHLINDWQYLSKDSAIGGRFASFTFVMISWLNTGLDEPDLKIDGFAIVIFGLGLKIRRS